VNHRIALIIATAVMFLPNAAQAHLAVSGMGPIYDGILHFSLSPEDYLPIVGLAFFAGLHGAKTARWALGALASAWLAGGLAAMAGLTLPALAISIATAVLFLTIGSLLASNFEVGTNATAVAGASLGMVRALSGLAGVTLTVAHTLTLLGMAASAFVVYALAASLTLPLRRAGPIIAVRVSGSWLAAVGLLLLGWIMRYGAAVG
jgi:hypothetical protein